MEDVNLLDYWRVLLKWKKLIAVIVGSAIILAVILTLLLPPIYRAEVTLMPVTSQKGGGLAMAAAQFGLGGLLGGLGTAVSPSAQLLNILKSRTLSEKIIEKYDLMKVLYVKLWDEERRNWKVKDPKDAPNMEDAVQELRTKVTFNDSKKDQLIIIRVELKDPELAARVANGYVQELIEHINKNAFTTAKRNRIFIEGQLERNKADLLESGKELAAFYDTNKISNVDPSVDVDVSVASNPSPPFGPANNETDIQIRTEEALRTLQSVQTRLLQESKMVTNVPQQVYLQYLTLRRTLLGQVNTLLTQQYELAKIEESKEDLNFQVIDWARVPIKRFKPKRRQMILTTFALSGFLSCFYVFFREYLETIRARKSPARSEV